MAWVLLWSACLWCFNLRTRAQEHVVLPFYANSKGGVSVLVDDVNLTRQGQSGLSLQMQFSLIGARQPSNFVTELTPRLYTPTDSVDFPTVRLLGRNAYYHDVRSAYAPDTADMEMRDRDAYLKQAYAKQIPYQDWMADARLKFVVRAQDGCGNQKGYIEKSCMLPYQQRFFTTERLSTVSTYQTQHLQGRAYISFPKKSIKIDPGYQNNKRELERIHHSIDSLLKQQDVIMKQISLKGFASPEGSYLTNVQLASDRVHSVKKYIMNTFGLDSDFIGVDYEPEDWDGLRKYIDESSIPERNGLLAIIDSIQDPDQRLSLISRKYPRAYRYLQDNIFVYLRHTDYHIEYFKLWEEKDSSSFATDSSISGKPFTTGQIPEGPAPELTQRRLHRFNPLLAIKTNLLFDAALTPNWELEIPLGKQGKWSRWSLMAEVWYPWWRLRHNPDGEVNQHLRPDQRPTRTAYQMLTGGLELRYWFGPRCNGSRPLLSGAFIGAYAAGGKYDLEWESEGSQGEFVSAGISIGYSWPISRHWNLELSAAGGYVYTPYRYYNGEFDDTRLIYKYSNTKHLFLPTKAKISLVWILGKKGGMR